MKKLIWFTTVFILFIVFVFPGVLALFIKMIPSSDQPGYDYNKRLAIYKMHDFTQEFKSTDENLTAIATSIRNPNLKNKKDIIFNLFDENNNLLRTSTLNGQNIEDGDFVKFVFDPIFDSKDKKYFFTLSSHNAGEEETIEVFIISPTDTVLNYEYQNEVHLGGVPLVTFYQPDSRWEVAKEVYSTWLMKLLQIDVSY